MSAYLIALLIVTGLAVLAGIDWVHEQRQIRDHAKAPTRAEFDAGTDLTDFFDVPEGTRIAMLDGFSGAAAARRRQRRRQIAATAVVWVVLIVALLWAWPS